MGLDVALKGANGLWQLLVLIWPRLGRKCHLRSHRGPLVQSTAKANETPFLCHVLSFCHLIPPPFDYTFPPPLPRFFMNTVCNAITRCNK